MEEMTAKKESWAYHFPKPDIKKIDFYKEQAHMKNADAQFNLGVCYEMGIGVEQDYKKAKQLYEESAKEKNISALCRLGCFYDEGIGGISKNRDKSAEYFKKAEKILIANFDHVTELSKQYVTAVNYLLLRAIKNENIDMIKQILPKKLKCMELYIKYLTNPDVSAKKKYFEHALRQKYLPEYLRGRKITSLTETSRQEFEFNVKKLSKKFINQCVKDNMDKTYLQLIDLKTKVPETLQIMVDSTIENFLNEKQKYDFLQQKLDIDEEISKLDAQEDIIIVEFLYSDSTPSSRLESYKKFRDDLIEARENIQGQAVSEQKHLKSIDKMIKSNDQRIKRLTEFELELSSKNEFSLSFFQSDGRNKQSCAPLTDEEKQELAQLKAKRRGLTTPPKAEPQPTKIQDKISLFSSFSKPKDKPSPSPEQPLRIMGISTKGSLNG